MHENNYFGLFHPRQILMYHVSITVGNTKVPFQFNHFESKEDSTCVNHKFIFLGQDKNPFVCTFYIL